MSTREEMIAHDRTIEEIAEELGADSLAYLSMDGVYEAVGTPREEHCDACFTGDYPLGDPRAANGKFALEEIAVVPAQLASRAVERRSASPCSPRAPGTNLQAILDQLHGRDGIEVVGVGSDKPDAPGARAGAAKPGSRPRSSPRPTTRTASARDAAIGGLARGSARPTWSCSPATCSCSRAVRRRFRDRIDQRPPRAAPVLPGPRRDRAGARPRGRGSPG